MVFNGHTEQYINSIDEELFGEIQVMYADGLLGNKGIYNALTPLTTGVFNYLRSKSSPAYTSDQIFPHINEYSDVPELDESANDSLLLFMTQAPGFKMDLFQK
tara:strand:+ start:8614 stop:8922 length:309 start_codon:yes stop_codon:yes gene_type:complete